MKLSRFGSSCIDDSGDLVAGHDGQVDEWVVAVEGVQVRTTDPNGDRANTKLSGAGFWLWHINEIQLSRPLNDDLSRCGA
jgi:hypothetical protein